MISGVDDKSGIWKLPAQGGEAVRVKYLNDVPKESPDGKFVYYGQGYPMPVSVWRMPVGGGEEVKVLDSVGPVASWTMIPEGIYYLTYTDDRAFHDLCFYEFATRRTRKIQALGEVHWMYGLTASPDGRTVLYSQLDESGSDLMLVENFR